MNNRVGNNGKRRGIWASCVFVCMNMPIHMQGGLSLKKIFGRVTPFLFISFFFPPSKNPLAIVSTCVQKQGPFDFVFGGWYGKSEKELRKVLRQQKGQKPD